MIIIINNYWTQLLKEKNIQFIPNLNFLLKVINLCLRLRIN